MSNLISCGPSARRQAQRFVAFLSEGLNVVGEGGGVLRLTQTDSGSSFVVVSCGGST